MVSPNGGSRRSRPCRARMACSAFQSGQAFSFPRLRGRAELRIARVEVSADGGKKWQLAALQDPVLPICATRFRFPWFWNGEPVVLQSRAADETGYVQPTLKQLVDIRGLAGPFGSVYHLNAIQ